jgi:hypothetical protein
MADVATAPSVKHGYRHGDWQSADESTAGEPKTHARAQQKGTPGQAACHGPDHETA